MAAVHDDRRGADRWRKAVEQLESDIPLYLENTAGGDNAMARHFDTIARVWEAIGGFPNMGFCLDTCHTHAAGEAVLDSAERILAITGRIDLVHCNDSKDDFGSGRDRHEHLGQGSIDPEAILEVCRKAGAPIICETSLDAVEDDIEFLRQKL